MHLSHSVRDGAPASDNGVLGHLSWISTRKNKGLSQWVTISAHQLSTLSVKSFEQHAHCCELHDSELHDSTVYACMT